MTKTRTEPTRQHDHETAILEAETLRVDTNVGPIERGISVLLGGALLANAFVRRTLGSSLLGAFVGAPVLARGVTGHCSLYRALGINTAAPPFTKTRPEVLRGMNVVKSIVVNRPVEECYSFWRGFENFPHFMDHVEDVTITGERTSHWVACAPLGQTVEWDAELVKDEKNHLIEWKSLDGSEVFHAGSVRFEPVEGGRRCKVTVTLRYAPPAGIAGLAVAKLLGGDPEKQIEEDLERFRQVLETGEVGSGENREPSADNREAA